MFSAPAVLIVQPPAGAGTQPAARWGCYHPRPFRSTHTHLLQDEFLADDNMHEELEYAHVSEIPIAPAPVGARTIPNPRSPSGGEVRSRCLRVPFTDD